MSKLLDKYNSDIKGIYNKFPQVENGDTQPFVSFGLNNVPEMNPFYEDQSNPFSESVKRDIERITDFSKSSKGKLFLGKQFLLQTGNTWAQTRLYNPLNPIVHTIPFIHTKRHINLRNSIESFLRTSDGNNGKIQTETWIDLQPKIDWKLSSKGGMKNTGGDNFINLTERGLRSRFNDLLTTFRRTVTTVVSPISAQIKDPTLGVTWEDSRPELQYDFVNEIWVANRSLHVYNGYSGDKDLTYLGQIPTNKFDRYISTDSLNLDNRLQSFIDSQITSVVDSGKRLLGNIVGDTVRTVNSFVNNELGIPVKISNTSILQSIGLSNVDGVFLRDLVADPKRLEEAGGQIQKSSNFEKQLEQYKRDVTNFRNGQRMSLGFGAEGQPTIIDGIAHQWRFTSPDKHGVYRKRYFKDFTQQNSSILQKDIKSGMDSDAIDIIFNAKHTTQPNDDFSSNSAYDLAKRAKIQKSQKLGIIRGIDNTSVRFRAFMQGFSEQVSPSYNESKYVGRYETFYTYQGVLRDCTFQLQLVAFSENELIHIWNKVNYLTSLAYPLETIGGYIKPTIFDITLGKIYTKQPVILTSLTHTLDKDVSWDIDEQLPMYVTCNVKLRLLDKKLYTHQNVMESFDIYGSSALLNGNLKLEDAKDRVKAEVSTTLSTISDSLKVFP